MAQTSRKGGAISSEKDWGTEQVWSFSNGEAFIKKGSWRDIRFTFDSWGFRRCGVHEISRGSLTYAGKFYWGIDLEWDPISIIENLKSSQLCLNVHS